MQCHVVRVASIIKQSIAKSFWFCLVLCVRSHFCHNSILSTSTHYCYSVFTLFYPLVYVFDPLINSLFYYFKVLIIHNTAFFNFIFFDMSLLQSRAKDINTLSSLFSTYEYVAICYVSKFHLNSLSLLNERKRKRKKRMMPLAPARISPYYASSCFLTRRWRQFLLISFLCLFYFSTSIYCHFVLYSLANFRYNFFQ